MHPVTLFVYDGQYMYRSIDQLHSAVNQSIIVSNNSLTITNEELLRNTTINDLVYASVFSEDSSVKQEAQRIIHLLAQQLGVIPSSLYSLYKAIGTGRLTPTFTVPAFNIRTLTYDTARVIFTVAIENNIGPFIFEIARSEMEYTYQSPQEYTTVILAAAIREGYTGPVFLQGDHYQFSARRYKENPEQEILTIKELVKKSIDAHFLQIDIDASTLVDLTKETVREQQQTNYELTAHITKYIRSLSLNDQLVSIGGEVGHIGGKNSTIADATAFMEGYLTLIGNEKGISKLSIQTGSSHGGIPLPDGTIEKIDIAFDAIESIGTYVRETYHLGGVAQHGASTLPSTLFTLFPKHKTLEIHLATGIQNIVFDTLPQQTKQEIYEWIEKNLFAEKENLTTEQFMYKSRKKALGPFKKILWDLPSAQKDPIRSAIKKRIEFLCTQLHVFDTKNVLMTYDA